MDTGPSARSHGTRGVEHVENGTTTPHVPPQPSAPPVPSAPPRGAPPLADWLRTPRPEAEPGIWRCGHDPLPAADPDRTPARQLVSGALVSFLIGWLVWSLLWNGYLGDYWLWPLYVLTPDAWRGTVPLVVATYLYYGLVLAGLAAVFGRLGHWDEVGRRAAAGLKGRFRTSRRAAAPPPPDEDPVLWPQLRRAGGGSEEAAERLSAEVLAGRMSDVDHARIERAWQSVRSRPVGLPQFTEAVLRDGAAACTHPSGARDLPSRAARHDLSLSQVRIGTAADDERNPQDYRGAGLALEPALLGTSALAVGPSGAGKTTRLVRPVVESLCLQALAGQAAVVAVTSSGTKPAPDDAFDVVVRPGRPESAYDLDLYGGTDDPDEAAVLLAEALVGDLAEGLPGGDSRRAATTLAQLLGPFRTAHGRFPAVPELRELLDGVPAPLAALREALGRDPARPGHRAHLRELDAYERQLGRPGDTGTLLADRVALLDRPAFADFFAPAGLARGAAGGDHRPFSLRALEHPLRVRIDLPERGHAEASRILARLVLAQFTDAALARDDQSLFACLVLDDADRTITPQALRGLQRLRSGHAGVLLTLRALDDVPEPLRGPLLGAVGCRVACAGVTPWDAERFAEVWGTEWVQTRDVTNRQLVSDEPLTKLMHGIRRMVTGRHVTAESVTVRTVQRQRWSASDLANELEPGQAVVSFTTVRGRRTPPVLARLGE
ncbi:ATP-binding protein [Streptomyces sp. RKND-216]|uniref:ATP-binding protein n=1 Tax=Streptomyces sp. RKND-216 TaxID=2562581 RepID=UPI00109E1D67|nr:ATP-binding protein [Streptomyces sp. RKND-216]THA24251.1 ATP-binding protein [Streptomyces sp. RKND-216]